MDALCGDEEGGRVCSSLICEDELQPRRVHRAESDGCSTSKELQERRSEDEHPGLDGVISEIQEARENQRQLDELLQTMRSQHHRDHAAFQQALEEEQLRWSVLERELVDLTELFQRETSSLREELMITKETTDYQAHDRAREFSMGLESCQKHLLMLEMQQQQQQVDTVGPEDSAAHLLLEKLIKALLFVLSALLVLVCAINRAVLFFKSSSHILSALLLAVLLFFVVKYWNIFPVYNHVFAAPRFL